MTAAAHLWAIGYDDMARADQVRDEIAELGKCLLLEDIAVVVRHPDGSFTFGGQRCPGLANVLACAGVGFLGGLVLAAPLTGATLGALTGATMGAFFGCADFVATHAGISEAFIHEVEAMIKPGTSALFVLDDEGDMEAVLHRIRGLGGTVLKTNVDPERARLIQSTLAAASPEETQCRRAE
jgi:uncharacterized membrane protein